MERNVGARMNVDDRTYRRAEIGTENVRRTTYNPTPILCCIFIVHRICLPVNSDVGSSFLQQTLFGTKLGNVYTA
jgi:hypothetical protein